MFAQAYRFFEIILDFVLYYATERIVEKTKQKQRILNEWESGTPASRWNIRAKYAVCQNWHERQVQQ